MQNKQFYIVTLDEEFRVLPSHAVRCTMGVPAEGSPRGEVYVDFAHPICSQMERLEQWRRDVGHVTLFSKVPLGKESMLRLKDLGFQVMSLQEVRRALKHRGGGKPDQVVDYERLLPPVPPKRDRFEPESWARLLAAIHAHRWTGHLYLKSDKVKKVISFSQGFPLAIKSNKSKELLGRMLVEEGVLPEDACDASLKRMKDEQILQGQALIRMGLLTEEQLFAALSRQWAIKLMDIFEWSEGEYVFKEEPLEPQTFMPPFAFCDLLSGGLLRLTSGIVEAALNLASALYVAAHPLPVWRYQPLPSTLDVEAFGRIDGRITLGQLMDTPGFDKNQKTLLCAMLMSHVLLLSLSPLSNPIHFGGFPLPGEVLPLPARMMEELEIEWKTGMTDLGRVETWLRRTHAERHLLEKDEIREAMMAWFNKLSTDKTPAVSGASDLRAFLLDWKAKYE